MANPRSDIVLQMDYGGQSSQPDIAIRDIRLGTRLRSYNRIVYSTIRQLVEKPTAIESSTMKTVIFSTLLFSAAASAHYAIKRLTIDGNT